MKQATFIIGSKDYSEWITLHEDIERLTLTGTVSPEEFNKLADELDYKKFHFICLQEVAVTDETYVFNEESYTICYWDNIASLMYDNEVEIQPLQKMYFNAEGTTEFLIEDDCIYTKDKSKLVHMESVPPKLEIDSNIYHIGNFAFAEMRQIESVVFPEGLKSIGAYAFASVEDLSIITLPDSITELGECTFYSCDIETLKLSANLKEIPDMCFQYNDLEEIEIPSSVKLIGNSAFHCNWLDKVIIPEGVEQIGYNAFRDLTHIKLPSTLESIAPDFYYEDMVDDSSHPPYIEVSPRNPVFYSQGGTLYFKADNKLALDHAYNGTRYDEECHSCPVHDYNIRQIKPSDDGQILQIARQAFEEYGAPLNGSVYDDPRMKHLSQEFERDDAEYWIVEDKLGKVLGGCGFYPTDGLPEGMAEVVKFYFSPQLRGKGLAPKLLMLIEVHAKQAGYTQLYIESFPQFKKAVKLYEEYGFKHIDRPLGNSGHSAVTVWMTKEIFVGNQQ